MTSKCVLLIHLLVNIYLAVTKEMTSFYIDGQSDVKFKDILSQTSADSFADCGVICLSHVLCSSYSYNDVTRQCLLSNRKFNHVDFFTVEKGWTSGILLSKVLVLSADKDYMGTISCTNIGARIATYAELEEAFSQGFTYCTEAWIERSVLGPDFAFGFAVSNDNACGGQTGVIKKYLDYIAQAYSWCILGGQYKGILGPESVASAWVLDKDYRLATDH